MKLGHEDSGADGRGEHTAPPCLLTATPHAKTSALTTSGTQRDHEQVCRVLVLVKANVGTALSNDVAEPPLPLAPPAKAHVSLTRVDTSDDVSLLRMGAIFDPRFFSLFKVEDQIRLRDWVSCPGEGQMAAAGVAVPVGSKPSLSTLKSSALWTSSTSASHHLCSKTL